MPTTTSTISALPPSSGPLLSDIVECSTNPGSGFNSVSVTLQQMATLVMAQFNVPGVSRWIPGYGFQQFDSDPAQSAHPWRTPLLINGVASYSGGVPAVAPAIPVLVAASHSGSQNNLTWTWTDTNYGGTGNLEVWKNGSLLISLANTFRTYSDTAGSVGNVYSIRWNNGTFASLNSNSIAAS